MEAMAMRKAVVSTPAGINGLPLTPGRDVIVAATGPEMAQAIRPSSRIPHAARPSKPKPAVPSNAISTGTPSSAARRRCIRTCASTARPAGDERDHRHPLLFLQGIFEQFVRDSKPAFKLVEQEISTSVTPSQPVSGAWSRRTAFRPSELSRDDNRDVHAFVFETFSNTHHVLTLITYIAVPGRVAPATS